MSLVAAAPRYGCALDKLNFNENAKTETGHFRKNFWPKIHGVPPLIVPALVCAAAFSDAIIVALHSTLMEEGACPFRAVLMVKWPAGKEEERETGQTASVSVHPAANSRKGEAR